MNLGPNQIVTWTRYRGERNPLALMSSLLNGTAVAILNSRSSQALEEVGRMCEDVASRLRSFRATIDQKTLASLPWKVSAAFEAAINGVLESIRPSSRTNGERQRLILLAAAGELLDKL